MELYRPTIKYFLGLKWNYMYIHFISRVFVCLPIHHAQFYLIKCHEHSSLKMSLSKILLKMFLIGFKKQTNIIFWNNNALPIAELFSGGMGLVFHLTGPWVHCAQGQYTCVRIYWPCCVLETLSSISIILKKKSRHICELYPSFFLLKIECLQYFHQ